MSDEAKATSASGVRTRSTAEAASPSAPAGSSTAASTSVLAEDVLDGRYRLQHRVARRGPVALWRGDDLVLARPVAVRVLAHAESESSAARLITAAVRSGRLVHAGAASTYDATTTETDSGTVAYVVSEWVDGSTLTGLLEDGPLSPDRAVRVVLAVARVLAAAHAREVTHGDLHPGDVVLTPHGGVKVLDLEVRAALTEEIAEASFEERRVRDVRGLGALLYACLTARWPLAGDRGLPFAPTTSDGSLCTPRQVRAGVSRELDAIALAALEADPDTDSDSGPDTNSDSNSGSDSASGSGSDSARAANGSGRKISTASALVEALETVHITGDGGYADGFSENYADSYTVGYATGPDGPTLVEPHQGGRLHEPGRHRRTRRIVIPLVLLLVCGLAAWLVGVAMGQLPGPSDKLPAIAPENDRPGPALSLTSVRSFDPLGDGEEQESTVPAAHDGDQSTAWTTDTYRTSNFGNLKSGVGLKVDFGRPEKVGSVRLAFANAGQSVELRAADTDAESPDAFPVRAQVVGGGTDVQLTPTEETPYRYWIVWVTQIPQTERGFRAELNEMVFLS